MQLKYIHLAIKIYTFCSLVKYLSSQGEIENGFKTKNGEGRDASIQTGGMEGQGTLSQSKFAILSYPQTVVDLDEFCVLK